MTTRPVTMLGTRMTTWPVTMLGRDWEDNMACHYVREGLG